MDHTNASTSRFLPQLKNCAGQGLVEYSILLMLIAMVIFVTLYGLGNTVECKLYEPVCSAVFNAAK